MEPPAAGGCRTLSSCGLITVQACFQSSVGWETNKQAVPIGSDRNLTEDPEDFFSSSPWFGDICVCISDPLFAYLEAPLSWISRVILHGQGI